MRITALIICLLSLASPVAASGGDWWWTQSAPSSRSMVDRGSIARNGAWATAWLQDFFVSPKGANQFSARYLIQHDCARGEVTVLSAQAFDGDGQPVTAPVVDRSQANSRLACGRFARTIGLAQRGSTTSIMRSGCGAWRTTTDRQRAPVAAVVREVRHGATLTDRYR